MLNTLIVGVLSQKNLYICWACTDKRVGMYWSEKTDSSIENTTPKKGQDEI